MKKVKTKTIKGILIRCLLFIPLAALSVLVILHGFFPEQAMRYTGFRVLLISDTLSMEPGLRANDLVVVRNCDFDTLQEGDIVTFKSRVRINGVEQTVYITHQIIEAKYDSDTGIRSFRTSGTSANVQPDRVLLTEDGANGTNQFVGRVAASNRTLGNMVTFLQSPWGLLMFGINALGVTLIIYLARIEGRDDEEGDTKNGECKRKKEKST